jgi:uncharacterized protein YndB with AHSA1/START domain
MIAPVRKSVRVKAPIAHAFEIFTGGLGRWWPLATHNISRKPLARVVLETRVGGRWLEIAEDGSECVVATIIAWEPPHRVALHWQINARWQPDATMKSEVDVRFAADGPDATVVDVLHHKFETMGAEDGTSLRQDVAKGWPGLVDRYAQEVERSFTGEGRS